MKQKRHNSIMALIDSMDIETQSELTAELVKLGYRVTQATVSRDIKELNIMKCQTGTGKYKYALPANVGAAHGNKRIRTIFSNSVLSVDYALNSIVIKTLSGMAQAAAITIESMEWDDVVGTIGGDDTVLVIARNEKKAMELAKKLKEMI